MDAWIRSLPKIELHHHLDGSFRTDTLWDLFTKLQTVGWNKFSFVDENSLKLAVRCDETTLTLEQFLSKFNVIHELLRAAHSHLPHDVYFQFLERFGREIVEDQIKVGCVYFETRFCPFEWISTFLDKNAIITDDIIVEAKMITEAIIRGMQSTINAQKFIAAKVILCGLWKYPTLTMPLVKLAHELYTSYDLTTVCVVGVDLAGNESDTFVPEAHKVAFRFAEQIGLGRTVHVGLPHRNIREAAEDLRATRIGHGYHLAEDHELIEYVKNKNIHVETSITPACRGMDNYHLKKQRAVAIFFERQISFSLNTDDATIKNIDLLDEYRLAANIVNENTSEKLMQLFTNMQDHSLQSTFLNDNARSELKVWLSAK